jgi:hypothetical protein
MGDRHRLGAGQAPGLPIFADPAFLTYIQGRFPGAAVPATASVLFDNAEFSGTAELGGNAAGTRNYV